MKLTMGSHHQSSAMFPHRPSTTALEMPLWWASIHPTATLGFPLVQASSPAPPSPGSHRWSVGIQRQSCAGEGGDWIPCFDLLGQTVSAGWAKGTVDRAQLQCAVYYFPSDLFKSVQLKSNSNLVWILEIHRSLTKFNKSIISIL
jgi:hypothetical protein